MSSWQKTISLFDRVEDTVGKGENAGRRGGGGQVVCPRKSTQIPENEVHCPGFV